MTNKNTDLIDVKDLGKVFGSLGGRATLKKFGKPYFKELSRKAAEARKAKKIAQS